MAHRHEYLIAARIWLIRAIFSVARRLPLRRRVILATSQRLRLDGNLACIHDELERRDPPIDVVTYAHRPSRGLAGILRTALNDVSLARHLATARVFVIDDYCLPVYAVRPRGGTTVIRTGHAIGPGKKWGYGLAGRQAGAHAGLLRRVKIHSNYTVCVLGSRNGIASYAAATATPPERYVTDIGIPRTDILLDPQRAAAAREAVRMRHPLIGDRRVILYAPTFRGEPVAATHPTGLDMARLAELLPDDHVLLVRQHPFVQAPLEIPPAAADFVIDVSRDREVNELLLVTDILVTDYSTVVYDFALLRRPVCFFVPDYETFGAQRGFYVDFTREGPGPTFAETGDLAAWIRSGDWDLAKVEQFRRHWLDVADGRASKRFVDRLVLPALAG